MPDAIDNLVQDINQNNTSVDEFPGYPGYKMGDLVPNMAGVRIGDPEYGYDPYGRLAPYNWRTGAFEFQAAPQDLSNPSTLATGGGMDYNVRDQPVERINDGNTDEKDAFVRTGIGTTLDPRTEDTYGVTGLVPPDKAGGFVGVDYLTPKQIEDLAAGQTASVPQGVVTRGETVKIPGRGLPDYRQIINDDGSISYLNEDTRKIDFTVPGIKGYPGVADLTGNPDLKLPSTLTKGTGTSVGATPFAPSPVGSYEGVGAAQPTTTSQGGFNNTGGNVTAGPGGTTNVTPDYIKPPNQGKTEDVPLTWSPATTLIDEIKNIPKGSQDSDSLRREIYERFDPTHTLDKPFTGLDEYGREIKWNWDERLPGRGSWGVLPPPSGGGTPNPPKSGDEGTTTPAPGTGTGTTPPPGGGTTTTPPGGGTTTTPPGGGTRPGTGTGPGTYTGTPLPPREPVTPLVRRETVIPTKGTKEVPIPDRQADPFAKLYADLLANAQQQKDQYRYINYDPEQIMNAAMSGFRRRGAMRSLQGY